MDKQVNSLIIFKFIFVCETRIKKIDISQIDGQMDKLIDKCTFHQLKQVGKYLTDDNEKSIMKYKCYNINRKSILRENLLLFEH